MKNTKKSKRNLKLLQQTIESLQTRFTALVNLTTYHEVHIIHNHAVHWTGLNITS